MTGGQKATVALAAIITAAAAMTGLGLFAIMGGGLTITADPAAAAEPCTVSGNVHVDNLDADQSRNANEIVRQGHKALPPKDAEQGMVIAVAVAYVESGVRNLASLSYPDSLNYPHDAVASGDSDSVGIMQQRAPWGSMAQRMNVAWSVRHFYVGGSTVPDGWEEPGLLDTPGWQDMSVADAAQAVQVSQYPDAYAAYADQAAAVVEQVTGQQVATGCDGENPPVASGPWTLPLAKGSYYNSAGFGDCGVHWSDCHTGYDMAGIPEGTDIYAAHAGTVESVSYEYDSYGWFTILNHGHGIQTAYAHQVSEPDLQPGQQVDAGEVIGHVGQTGNTTGIHLHFEVRINGEPVDPVPFMEEHGAPL